jgi:hypothetical protein
MTDEQLKIHLREMNGGIIPNLGRNPSRVETINALLDDAAKGMSFYDEQNWWVAKQVWKHDADKVIMHADLSTLS